MERNNSPEPFEPGRQPEIRRLPSDSPKIYVASLADYNNGKIHGVWIDATLEPEEIQEQIRAMLQLSTVLSAEDETFGDWVIHDSEGFGLATVHEHDDLQTMHRLAMGIAEYGLAFSAWADVFEGDSEHWEQFSEAYLGEYYSLTAYGETIIDDMGWQQEITRVLPESVARYARIDAEALAQDMWLSGEIQIIHRPGGGMWVFRGDA
jgi:antirestriction protein